MTTTWHACPAFRQRRWLKQRVARRISGVWGQPLAAARLRPTKPQAWLGLEGKRTKGTGFVKTTPRFAPEASPQEE